MTHLFDETGGQQPAPKLAGPVASLFPTCPPLFPLDQGSIRCRQLPQYLLIPTAMIHLSQPPAHSQRPVGQPCTPNLSFPFPTLNQGHTSSCQLPNQEASPSGQHFPLNNSAAGPVTIQQLVPLTNEEPTHLQS
ncbi:hypothetical protein AAC387_Pa04g1325 [Persea americana]